MELLLNLLWLAMAVPAIWVWRRTHSEHGHPGPLASALLLGCVLVVLFPTISASDDLQPMRAEAEESSASKRTVQQAAHHQLATPLQSAGHLCPYLVGSLWLIQGQDHAESILLTHAFFAKPMLATAVDERGPPSVRLA